MKREELKAIVEGITDEQLQKILDINNADVEKTKGKMQPEIDGLKQQVAESKKTITTLEANKGDTAALQAELDKYKQAEEQRKQEEKDAAERAKVLERFNAAKGDKEFSSEYAENGVLDAFSKAIADPANTGKGDAELFASLTHDKEGVFKSAHPSVNMGGIKGVSGPDTDNMTDAEYYATVFKKG